MTLGILLDTLVSNALDLALLSSVCHMGVQERRAREKQELRQEILDAARELFIREGFENVSMRKIADKIEYSPTTIYLHFQDKADLLDCICEETLGKLQQRLAAIGE